jgi:hypothetical protein
MMNSRRFMSFCPQAEDHTLPHRGGTAGKVASDVAYENSEVAALPRYFCFAPTTDIARPTQLVHSRQTGVGGLLFDHLVGAGAFVPLPPQKNSLTKLIRRRAP